MFPFVPAAAGLKRCSRCGAFKPPAHFHRDRSKKDGRGSTCKPCAIERARRHYRAVAREPRLAASRTRRQERRGADYLAGVQKRCSRCRSLRSWAEFYEERRARDGKASSCVYCHRAYHRARWPKIRTRENRRRGERARANPSQGERVRRWHAEHEQRVREIKRASRSRRRAEDPWAVNAPTRAYRARKHAAAGSHTATQARARCELFGGRCWLCRALARDLDHVKPLTRGGSDFPANLRPICKRCNSGKSNRWPLPAAAHRRALRRAFSSGEREGRRVPARTAGVPQSRPPVRGS